MSKPNNINWFKRPIVGTYTWWESGECAQGYRGQGRSQVLVVGETDKLWWFAYSKEQLRNCILHSARKTIQGSRGNYCRLSFDLKAIQYDAEYNADVQAIQDKMTKQQLQARNKAISAAKIESELKRYVTDENPETAQMARDALASKDYQSFYNYLHSL